MIPGRLIFCEGQGADHKAIQGIMRHGKFSTTERYLHRLTDVRTALKLLPGKKKVLPAGTSDLTKAKQGAADES